MPRAPQRLISFVMLLSFLISLLPVAQPAPPVAAAPVAAEPQESALRIPRPNAAKSSSLPETFVSTMRSLHGETHTTSGAVDGTYSQESIPSTHVHAAAVAASGTTYHDYHSNGVPSNQYRQATYDAPAGPYTHDALTFAYKAEFSNGGFGSTVTVSLSV